MMRRLALIFLPPIGIAAIGAAVATWLGRTAMQGAGVALLAVGVLVAYTMAQAGDSSITG